MRKEEVAVLAGVSVSQVHSATSAEVREFYADRATSAVVNVMMKEPASYWRVGDRYYFDDPYFGDVVAVDDLDYDSTLGLHVRRGN